MFESILSTTARQRYYDARESFRAILANSKRMSRLDADVLETLNIQYDPEYTTTGVGPGDIAFLHHFIKTRKPSRVIEFGTGKTTWIIARAMSKYCKPPIRLVSMEEEQEWYDAQLKHMPDLGGFVEVIHSDIEPYSRDFITGMAYVKTPMEQFDFCFVDGLNHRGSCCMDFIKLLEQADEPMSAILDAHLTTQMALACLIGINKIQRFRNKMALVEGVTKDDLTIAHSRMFGSSTKRLPI